MFSFSRKTKRSEAFSPPSPPPICCRSEWHPRSGRSLGSLGSTTKGCGKLSIYNIISIQIKNLFWPEFTKKRSRPFCLNRELFNLAVDTFLVSNSAFCLVLPRAQPFTILLKLIQRESSCEEKQLSDLLTPSNSLTSERLAC